MDSRMTRIGPLRPEAMALRFTIYAPESKTAPSGRERVSPGDAIGITRCVLSGANSEERERFHQARVEVSHVLTGRGALAAYTDCLLVSESGRRFRVKATRDKGGLGVFCAYYCEELL